MGGPSFIDGKVHYETDNFRPLRFKINGLEYSSPENYFQSTKARDEADKEKIRLEGKTGLNSWAMGGAVPLRSDWEEIKVDVMYEGNKACFEQHPETIKPLIESKGKAIFGNSSPFWNFWNARIMERLRAEFRDTEEDKEFAELIKETMQKYALSPKTFKF